MWWKWNRHLCLPRITKKGRDYLADLLTTYETFFQGIQAILSGEEST